MTSGLRATPQREHVYSVLLNKRDHPTADEVFARVKAKMPTISLATVYYRLKRKADGDREKALAQKLSEEKRSGQAQEKFE